MENTHKSMESLFADIADAIRAQNGSEEPISADNFPAEIDALVDNTLLLSIIDGSITELPKEVLEEVEYIGDKSFIYGQLKSLTIPGNVKYIGVSSFHNNSQLSTVVLLEGVERLETQAFSSCSRLASIVIPSSMKKIGYRAFVSYSALTDVYYTGT